VGENVLGERGRGEAWQLRGDLGRRNGGNSKKGESGEDKNLFRGHFLKACPLGVYNGKGENSTGQRVTVACRGRGEGRKEQGKSGSSGGSLPQTSDFAGCSAFILQENECMRVFTAPGAEGGG